MDSQKKRCRVYIIFILSILAFGSARCSRDQKNQSPLQKNNQATNRDEPESAVITVPIPDWAADAIWYSIDVDRFHNGDPTNDPDGTVAWSSDWLVDFNDIKKMEGTIFGGDLKGLKQRLPYLKKLGVNTLLLSSVFQGTTNHPDKNIIHHINDNYGKHGSVIQLKHETHDPATWVFTESDRIFIDFLKEAHRMRFRVVVGMNLFMIEGAQDNISSERQNSILASTRRWMDPNGDGDPSDGVDGWQVTAAFANKKFTGEWKKHVVKLNKEALILGHGGVGMIWDARVQYFFNVVNKSEIHKLKDIFTIQQNSQTFNEKLVQLCRIGQPMIPQLILASRGQSGLQSHAKYPSDQLQKVSNQWRLTVIFQYFDLGAPLIYYGNEVGILRGIGPYANPPMWWPDLPDPKTKSPDYRGDFFALIQWLNETRTKYAPIRRGELREVMLDEENHILAFARSYNNEEVILVMNYGSTKQKVMLPAGIPGQKVITLSPHLTRRPARGEKKIDYTAIRRLSVGAARQFVNKEGKIRMWIDPMSVRVVLITNK